MAKRCCMAKLVQDLSKGNLGSILNYARMSMLWCGLKNNVNVAGLEIVTHHLQQPQSFHEVTSP